MLARCRMVSICSPDSFAFFIADVARGQPDKLGARRDRLLAVGLGAGLGHRQSPWTWAQVSTPARGAGCRVAGVVPPARAGDLRPRLPS